LFTVQSGHLTITVKRRREEMVNAMKDLAAAASAIHGKKDYSKLLIQYRKSLFIVSKCALF